MASSSTGKVDNADMWRVVAVVLAGLAVGGGGCFSEKKGEMKQSTKNGADDVRALGQELGVSLPPDAKVVGVDRQAGMDDMIRAKFELSPSGFSSIAEHLPLKVDQLSRRPGRLGTDHEFWNPRATPGLRSGQVQLPGARVLHIGVAEYPDKVVLFVLNHGT